MTPSLQYSPMWNNSNKAPVGDEKANYYLNEIRRLLDSQEAKSHPSVCVTYEIEFQKYKDRNDVLSPQDKINLEKLHESLKEILEPETEPEESYGLSFLYKTK